MTETLDLDALYLAAAEQLLQALPENVDNDRFESLIDDVLRSHVPAGSDHAFGEHRRLFMPYVAGLVEAIYREGRSHGLSLVAPLGPDARELPVLIDTTALVAVVYLPDWDAVMAFDAMFFPESVVESLATRFGDVYGRADDVVVPQPVPLGLGEFQEGAISAVLDRAVAEMLVDGDTSDATAQSYERLVMKRTPLQPWEMPAGTFAVPFCLPVTVASLVLRNYWFPGDDGPQIPEADIAALLKQGFEEAGITLVDLDVYGGHLHFGDGLMDISEVVMADVSKAGGKRLPLQTRSAKVGRNDPCSCGSGKKFKKCCAD